MSNQPDRIPCLQGLHYRIKNRAAALSGGFFFFKPFNDGEVITLREYRNCFALRFQRNTITLFDG
ncbi:hypothetical protein RCCS2_15234 [Roseobacter sp. CCS2]|nr:hypothetical protein RCCS2_15234 [Roseobacter sp. CCS2]